MPTYNAKSWWYKVRRDALKDAARDVCPICDGRSVGTARLNRPNESGNYTHGDVLCSASAIWSRLANEQDPSCEPVKSIDVAGRYD